MGIKYYITIAASITFVFLACAGSKEQINKSQAPAADIYTDFATAEQKTCDQLNSPDDSAATNIPDEFEYITKSPVFTDKVMIEKAKELKKRLLKEGVPGEWFDRQMQHETFQIHHNIDRYFQKAAEKQVDHDQKRDSTWYFAKLGVKAKIEKGKKFIEANKDIFGRAEAKNGIHRELIAAILGIETNFADFHQRGNFYVFNSLVSQYIYTKRKKFAVREIMALYRFSQKTGLPPYYFTSSYAGAVGWGQFIPSSLLAFFIDANGIHEDTDPFCVEDTIFSIENYLNKHNLSGKNMDDYDARYKAIFAYNKSDIYVKAVLFIYEGLREYFCQTTSSP